MVGKWLSMWWRKEWGGKGFGSVVGSGKAERVMDGGVRKRFAGEGGRGDGLRGVAAARVRIGGVVEEDEDILGIFENG
ncbi:unnamed protein product [Camellia sinensis]